MSAKRVYLERSTVYLSLISGIVLTNFLDPVNWPKQILLISLAPLILLRAILESDIEVSAFTRNRVVILYFGLPLLVFWLIGFASHFFSDLSLVRVLWGSWGRNNGLLTLSGLWIVAVATAVRSCSTDFLRTFLKTIEVTGTVFVFYGIFQFLGLDPVSWSQTNQVFSFFGNTNFASAIFALIAASSMALLLYEKEIDKKVNVFRLIFLTITVYACFLTRSVQGLAALLICACLFFLVRLNKNTRLKIFLFVLYLACGFVVILGTIGKGPFGKFIQQYTVELRLNYWLTGIKMGKDNWLLGVGVDSYGDYYRTYRSSTLANLTSIDLVTNNAHNVFIQLFATFGVFGLLALIIPFFTASFFALRLILSNDANSKIRGYIAAIFLALWAMSSFSIDNIAIAVWNYAFLGAILGIKHEIKSSVKTRVKKTREFEARRILGTSLSAILFIGSWTSSVPDREVRRILSQKVNLQDSTQVSNHSTDILKASRGVSLQESQYWYLANEGAKLNRIDVIDSTLKLGIAKFKRDFNLLDYKAVSLENTNRRILAGNYRKLQLDIDPRHPRVWLNYAYDLLEEGKKFEAKSAFSQVLKYQSYLDDNQRSQLPEISKLFE